MAANYKYMDDNGNIFSTAAERDASNKKIAAKKSANLIDGLTPAQLQDLIGLQGRNDAVYLPSITGSSKSKSSSSKNKTTKEKTYETYYEGNKSPYKGEMPKWNDEFKDKLRDLVSQIEDFGKTAGEYDSKYIPIIESLKQSLEDGTFFDAETDPRAIQYRNDYTRAGQKALEDTIGKISARTGGLASSYATSAAEQQYDNYMQDLAGKIMDLRNLAEQSVRSNINENWKLENDAYAKWQDDYNRRYGELQQNLANYQGLSDNDYQKYLNDLDNYWNKYNAYLNEWKQVTSEKQFQDQLALEYAKLQAQQSAAMGGISGGRSGSGGGSYSGGGGGGSSSSSSGTETSAKGTANYYQGQGSNSIKSVGGTNDGSAGRVSGTFSTTNNGTGSGKTFSDYLGYEYDERGFRKN